MATDKLQNAVRELCAIAEFGRIEPRSDGQLLRDYVARREQTAFSALVRRHGPMVLSVCRRVLRHRQDADDAFQATFLVLASKAAALGHREIIGNWLYGVAYNTALKARAAAAVRIAKEKTVAKSAIAAPQADREALDILDHELNLLPAKYRAPIVLCDLEGKTYKQVSEQLRCPDGTVACRLARGRELLAKRLTRRGVTVGAAVLTAAVPQLAPAPLTASLFVATLGAVSGSGSPHVIALASMVAKVLLIAKLKKVVACVACVCTFVFVAGAFHHSFAGEGTDSDESFRAKTQVVAIAPEQAKPPIAKGQQVEVLAPLWRRPMLLDKYELTGRVDHGEKAKVWFDKAMAARGDEPSIPPFRPLVVGNSVIYRTYHFINAVHLSVDKKSNEYKAGEIIWKSVPNPSCIAFLDSQSFGFGYGDVMFGFSSMLEIWLKKLPPATLPAVLLDSGFAGAMSQDAHHLYYLIDLATLDETRILAKPWDDGLRKVVTQNTLNSVDLQFGKLELGLGYNLVGPKDPFWNGHFLATPSTAKDKAYVLHETDKGDLRVVAIEPVKGTTQLTLTLQNIDVQERFLANLQRRLNPAQLMVADDLLVCLPHTGKIFGVDNPKLQTRWTYTYRKDPPPKAAKIAAASWKAPAPFIQDGKLVFTTADDDHLHCLNLQDGKLIWKVKRADDLYLAGIAGDKVLLVGRSACRALALKDGHELWKVSTGLPGGIGVFDKATYLLPLRLGATSNRPEIAYLDIDQGKVLKTSPLSDAPGNLLIHNGFIVSQSEMEIAAYAREKAK